MMSSFWEALRTGASEIYSHKTRSFLSFSSIAFGVAAILYTFAHVNQMFVRRQKAFELAGPGRLEVTKERVEGKVGLGLSKGLTLEDAAAIREAMPELYMVSPTANGWGKVHDRDFHGDASLLGVTPEWRKRDWVYTMRGRFFDSHDLKTASRVCVVVEPGGWIEKPFWARWWTENDFEKFVKRNDLLGREIRIKDHLFVVVGVLQEPPRDKDPRWFRMGGSPNILVPVTAFHRFLANPGKSSVTDAINQIQIDTGDERTVAAAKRRLEALFAVRHRGEKDYEVQDFRDMIQNILNEMKKYAIAVLSVGIVAIISGGIGIMNVTLATIFSRIREIGIRRAVGATRADILLQFVTEAMLLGFLGGLAGVGLGLLGVVYLSDKTQNPVESLRAWHFLATLAIAVGAGFAFSLFPAYKASQLDPVEALRYE